MPDKDLSTTNYCEVCKKPFHPWKRSTGKFCSHKCSANGRKKRETVYVEFVCKCCGKECKRPKYATKSTFEYCSLQCMANVRGKNMSGENHPKWKGGSNRVGTGTICKRIKAKAAKCEECGKKEKLHTHHKIKVSDRPDLAKDPSNIMVLCRECHAKKHPEYEGMLLKKRFGTYKNCILCNKEFYAPKSSYKKFCSRACQFEGQKRGFFRKCKICEKEFYVKESKRETRFCCSIKCRTIDRVK